VKIKNKYKVTFLLDPSNLWIEKYLKNKKFSLKNKFIFKITKNQNLVENQDIVFALSYTKILPNEFLKKNKLTLIAHASKLPKDRGAAPIQYQVLEGKKKFFISLIKAEEKLDSGYIYCRDFFILKGYELSDEIRKRQAETTFRVIKFFLNKLPKIKSKAQRGKPTFRKRRTLKDSELDINKSIKSQFNLLRICDNESYPAYFYLKKKKYTLKIFLEK